MIFLIVLLFILSRETRKQLFNILEEDEDKGDTNNDKKKPDIVVKSFTNK